MEDIWFGKYKKYKPPKVMMTTFDYRSICNLFLLCIQHMCTGLLYCFLALLPTVLQRADSRGAPCFPASSPDPGTCFLRSSYRDRENKKIMTFNEVFTKKRRIVAKAIKKWDKNWPHSEGSHQGVTKRCRLSRLTNSALVYA
jgi:hypothetical protein